jgi:hypothetical protein
VCSEVLTEKQALALARNHQPYGVVLPMSLALSATCLLRAQEAEAEHTLPKVKCVQPTTCAALHGMMECGTGRLKYGLSAALSASACAQRAST